MSQQPPSVGRVVHFYGEPQGWKYCEAVPEDKEWKRTFAGPFAATIVKVNETGTVNLRVDYPTMLIGTDRCTELVMDVSFIDSARQLPEHMCWTWPPRVGA